MKKPIFLLLFLIPISLARTIDLGNIYPFYDITYSPEFNGLLNISVNFTNDFYIFVNGSMFEDNPVILFKITNDTNELNLNDSVFLLENSFQIFKFPKTTKTLYYLFSLNFINTSSNIYGNRTFYIDIYTNSSSLNLLEEVEIKFNALPETTVPSTLLPKHVSNMLYLTGSIILIGIAYRVMKIMGIA